MCFCSNVYLFLSDIANKKKYIKNILVLNETCCCEATSNIQRKAMLTPLDIYGINLNSLFLITMIHIKMKRARKKIKWISQLSVTLLRTILWEWKHYLGQILLKFILFSMLKLSKSDKYISNKLFLYGVPKHPYKLLITIQDS